MANPSPSWRELHPIGKVFVALLALIAGATLLGCLVGVGKWVWFVALVWHP